jgi:uncharacterized membrane protein (DUF2068 family)
MSDISRTQRGLQAVAIFEAVKAVLILAVGFGLFSLINRDVEGVAELIVRKLHLNPVNKYPHIFLEAANHVTNTHLLVFASLAMIDAAARAAVGYGLWYERTWGKWLGVATAGIYIPLEIFEMYRHYTPFKLAAFLINVAIVVYLGLALYWEKRDYHASSPAEVPSQA